MCGARAEQDNGKPTNQNVTFRFFALLPYLPQVYISHEPANAHGYTLIQPRYGSSRASTFFLCDSHEQLLRGTIVIRTHDIHKTYILHYFCEAYLVLITMFSRNSVSACVIEPSILQQPAGTTVPGSTVGTQRTVQLLPFFACPVCGRCLSVYQNVLQASYTTWQPQQPRFKVVPL